MNQLEKVFNYQNNQVRTIVKNGEPWFVVRDITKILEIDPSQSRRLDDDEKGLCLIQTQGGKQEMICINEAGLYSLILGSRKKEAKTFKRWVTHEVLPQIRKTGRYGVPQTFHEALRLAADLAEENQKLVPKAETYDRFISGDGVQKMNVVAKVLGWGRNKFLAELRDKNIFMNNNTPYQRYIEQGYFVVKETPNNGFNFPTTYATAKGIDWLDKLINKERVSV